MQTQTTRERFSALMNFQPFDRLPLLEWASWWDKTIARWHGEGLPPQLTDRYAICRHLGLEVYRQEWFPPYGNCPRGATREERQRGVLAQTGSYDRARTLMYPPPHIGPERWVDAVAEHKRGEAVIWFTLEGFFWFPRELLGVERHLYAFYDEAELLHRINADLTEWNLAMIDEICSFCDPDFMTFAEDMSYNHGSMLSKSLFDEFLSPYYAQILPALKERGIIALIDSDGDISTPAHWFKEAGLDGILPLERQSGVDIATLRRDHADMRFIGHFDKMTMHQGEQVMRAEFERLLPIAAQGGFIISCDHQTPPGVSYKDYALYLTLFKEYAAEAGRLSQQLGPRP